jgi:uncharacterized protein with GYD domain
MPKYLIEASYGPEGVKGVARNGGTARREIIELLIGSLGGKMQSFYFAFGDADVYVIADLPSDEAATALALSVNQSAATTVKTIVLLTPEQVDSAAGTWRGSARARTSALAGRTRSAACAPSARLTAR